MNDISGRSYNLHTCPATRWLESLSDGQRMVVRLELARDDGLVPEQFHLGLVPVPRTELGRQFRLPGTGGNQSPNAVRRCTRLDRPGRAAPLPGRSSDFDPAREKKGPMQMTFDVFVATGFESDDSNGIDIVTVEATREAEARE